MAKTSKATESTQDLALPAPATNSVESVDNVTVADTNQDKQEDFAVSHVAVPDNSKEALEKNKLINESRAFVRAQGVADHLFTDESVVAEYERFKGLDLKGKNEFKIDLETTSHRDKNAGVVTRGEYSTAQGDVKPYYKDADSDPATPATLKNE